MRIFLATLLFVFSFITFSHNAYAGAAVQSQQSREKMRKQLEQMPPEMREKVLQQQLKTKKWPIDSEQPGRRTLEATDEDEEVTEITLGKLIEMLETSSEIWEQIMDKEIKVAVVTHFIKQYRQQHINIARPPAYYAARIDSMIMGNPGMLTNSFDKVLQIVSIMDYDFDNGQDRDALARQALGPTGYEQNRRRLSSQR